MIRRFSADYWKFFAAALCMDLGFGLFFFLFNLYLTDLHFNERTIGQVTACLTLGNVAGTLPAMLLARRRGLRPLLLGTFLCAPLLCALRVWMVGEPAQLILAFATGVALCGWPICFSPAIAALTNAENRSLGFSLAFATGIGSGVAAGFAGGLLPAWLHASALHLPLIDGIRAVLFAACAVTLLGALPLRAVSLGRPARVAGVRMRTVPPFLYRFLPAFVLWNVATGSFPVFGAVYLQKALGIPLGNLGAVFSGSQFAQFGAVLLAPMLFRRMGNARGIAAAQVGTAVFLLLIAGTRSVSFAVCFYLLYFASQFMCSPGIYELLMVSVAEEERGAASALQNLCGALCQAGSAALTGVCIVRFGYSTVLVGNAGAAVAASALFFLLGSQMPVKTALSEAKDERVPLPEELGECPELQIEQAGG